MGIWRVHFSNSLFQNPKIIHLSFRFTIRAFLQFLLFHVYHFFFSIFTVHCLLLLFILPLCSFHFSTVHYPFTVFIFQFIVVLKPPIVLMPLTEFFKLDTWLNIFIYIYLIYIFKYLPNLIYSYQFFASIFWCALNSESALALISYQSQWTLWVHCTSKCLQEPGKNKFSFDKYSNMYILVTCPIKKISINGNKNGQQWNKWIQWND